MDCGWPITWADANNTKSKAITGTLDMGWASTFDVDDAGLPVATSWEATGIVVSRDSSGVKVSDVFNGTGFWDEDTEVKWEKTGLELLTNEVVDALPVTAWVGEGTAVVTDGNITGANFTATRPLVPTTERHSMLTLKNLEPAYMCAYAWTNTNDGVSGSAESGCA